MKRIRFSEEQIIAVLREHEAGAIQMPFSTHSKLGKYITRPIKFVDL